ncbi:MAG TPA: cytochrome c biogenesis protein ResB [Smithella sp.]|nr:cytochrome c biogenesis protein ResB [Smithella sp.]
MPKNKNVLWLLFSSVKLTITLLVLMVLVFMAATFLPEPLSSQKFAWLADLYHSSLFYTLMGLLSLNLIVCSMNRFPASLKQYKALPFPEGPGIFNDIPSNRKIITDKEKSRVNSIIESCLHGKFGVIRKMDTEKGRLFYGEKRRFSIFGPYIVHLSILIMMAGVFLGSVFGLKADVDIKEGETVNAVSLARGRGMQPLDFSVRCDKFTVEYYENGAPKTYRSDLSFIKNGQALSRGSVLVNHPVTFEGLRFYQSGYGMLPQTRAILTFTDANSKSAEISLAQGDTFVMPRYKATVTVLGIEENIMQLGPAVELRIVDPRRDVRFWVLQNIEEIAADNPGLFSQAPLLNPALFKPVIFSLSGIEQNYFTVLHVVRDPGIPLVAAGGALLIAGLFIIFFLPYYRVWVKMEQDGKKVQINVAGRGYHDNAAHRKNIDKLCNRIDQELKA